MSTLFSPISIPPWGSVCTSWFEIHFQPSAAFCINHPTRRDHFLCFLSEELSTTLSLFHSITQKRKFNFWARLGHLETVTSKKRLTFQSTFDLLILFIESEENVRINGSNSRAVSSTLTLRERNEKDNLCDAGLPETASHEDQCYLNNWKLAPRNIKEKLLRRKKLR